MQDDQWSSNSNFIQVGRAKCTLFLDDFVLGMTKMTRVKGVAPRCDVLGEAPPTLGVLLASDQ